MIEKVVAGYLQNNNLEKEADTIACIAVAKIKSKLVKRKGNVLYSKVIVRVTIEAEVLDEADVLDKFIDPRD